MKLSISNIGWTVEQDSQVYELMKKYGFTGLEIAPTRIFPEAPYEKLNEADRDKFMAEKQEQFAQEPADIHKRRVEDAIKAGENTVEELQELFILKQVQNVSPFISLSEISKTYFGKSRGWLSQRLHENKVRGRRVSLKPEEINILKSALLDISDKLKHTAMQLDFS